MKRFWLLIPMFVFIFSIAAAKPKPTPVPAQPVYKGPKIQFFHLKHEFGDRMEGPAVTHLFRFKNIGTETLKISNVHASCGCTAANTSADEIPPGGEGAIKATYNTQGRPGKATKTVSLNTNDLKSPSITLEFTVNVIREIDMTPDRAYFYGVRKGQTRSVTISILARKGKSFKVLSADSKQKKVTTTLAPLSQDGREGANLVVILPAESPLGDLNDEVVLKTTDLKKPEITIPVNGEVIGRVQVIPKTLSLGNLTQPMTLNVAVDPAPGFAIRSISTEKRLVKPWVQKQRLGDGKDQYQIVVVPPNPKVLPVGPFSDTLHLITNDPEQGDIAVPVTGSKN